MSMRFAPTFMCKQKLPLLHMPNGGGIDLKILHRPQKEKVVVVMGATGAGKSRLSVDLATRFSAEIVNADKMQVYQGFDVLTNKVTDEEAGGVPHHLLGIIDPEKDFTAKNFCNAASRCIKSIAGRGRLPMIAGGSNSFIEALVEDEDSKMKSKYDWCFICVDVALPVLHSFVSERVDRMVEKGMIEEARGMFNPASRDYSKGLRRAIGMQELDRYFRIESDEEHRARLLEDAINDVKKNTRTLACRQLEKIKRLKHVKGWKIHRLDATEAFLKRGGSEADQAWENLVVAPGTAILNRFLHSHASSGSLFFTANNLLIPPAAARATVAAAAIH
ncbi:PREDICTED: adenylate isopentenyltransferase 3, chloroplastic-like [Ipomoea nil]|uniref:adenylate dimethylallyltransferase (ADP/ATP-dependent) n=1 Tax=Ipomoea nil TaxID=35883 RepID=B3XZI3_IPONI|nr:PREDICTED: adenylate isopentenyltransferase 3, chloroplastic-like [Ipomoea nil]BAG55006.1 adenylate isopentenyltransferase [Ipomoea nil]